jgi:choline dehydrogenase-like flavoprotein
MAAYERMASFGVLIHDSSTGRVIPFGRRSLNWYWMNRDDVRRLARGVSIAARIFFAAGARAVYSGVRQLPVLQSAQQAETLERLRLRAGDLEMMAFHPMGTAHMGADPRRCPVDPAGRLRGTSGLFVADASLFPTSTRVNPQLTIMALAARVARGFLEDRPAGTPC